MTPAFMIMVAEVRVPDVFAALAASSDSSSRSRLALHLPWSPARILERDSGNIGLGIRGWHGWARDVENSYSFALSLRSDAPCDLSVYVGQTYALFEIRASTREAAKEFSEESTRAKSRFVSAFEGCALGIWYDNEHDPWRVVLPRNHVAKIHCSLDDIREHDIVVRDPIAEAVDVDRLGGLLAWLVSED